MKRRQFVHGIMATGALAALGSPRSLEAIFADRRPGATRLDNGWKFLLGDARDAAVPAFNDADWQPAVLPHSARIEALVTGPPKSPTAQWQGVCWYRRTLRIDGIQGSDKAFLKFDGAMNVADVFLDGEQIGTHMGGYLPFVLDISDKLTPGRDHLLAVRLDNRDNPITGPKPLDQLDFNMYHGLYRPVHLIRKNSLHITDAILAGRPAGGGLFVTYPAVSRNAATVRVQSHVRNDGRAARTFRVRATLLTPADVEIARVESQLASLGAGAQGELVTELQVANPALWSPAAPNLHNLQVDVVEAGEVVDSERARIGIRRIDIAPNSFTINGEKMFLRGTNRHQEYPYIGYALSAAAQFRDARKIKDAGFDYIRLSHYAHAPAFMDACDELGIVVMNCIPGWQYFGKDPAFTELQYQNCRDLIRRDRNHACVVMWEVSLNETGMPPEFIATTHAIAHEEYPGDQCFTTGWVKGYDVFIQARQHGGCHRETDSACVVSEYGDWEYYAMTAGLNQNDWSQLTAAESNSRQLRWQGERAMLQQAANFQEAHDDNRSTIAFADGLWVMYDYNRGYAPDIESSGCMDIFRLPKYSYYFFQSQRSPAEQLSNATSGPMVFIASDWTSQSAPEVRVFSNCEEVGLYLDGQLIARKDLDRGRMSTRLSHPPFTFRTRGFRPGMLEAIGYITGREAARHTVRTPGPPENLRVYLDLSGHAAERGSTDQIFCYALLEDAHGTVVPAAWHNVGFGVTGGGRLLGMNPIASDAGIATILLETDGTDSDTAVHALALIQNGDAVRVVSGSAALRGRAPAPEVRSTNAGSSLYTGDQMIAAVTRDAPRFRLPASAPPDARTEFHQ